MKDLFVSKLKDYYGSLLTSKQSEAVEQYYDLDYSLAEIGENLSITRQAVHSTLRQAVEALQDYEERLGFLKRDERLLGCLERMKTTKSDGSDEEERINGIVSEIMQILF